MSLIQRVSRDMFAMPRGLLGVLGTWLMAHGNGATEQRALWLARLAPGDKVLIVGCGPGLGVVGAARQGAAVVALDPSHGMICATARRLAGVTTEQPVLVGLGGAESTRLPVATCNVAISVNNIHLWPSAEAGFAELRRVLCTGGRVVVSVHKSALPQPAHDVLDAARRSGFEIDQVLHWRPPSIMAGDAWQVVATAR